MTSILKAQNGPNSGLCVCVWGGGSNKNRGCQSGKPLDLSLASRLNFFVAGDGEKSLNLATGNTEFKVKTAFKNSRYRSLPSQRVDGSLEQTEPSVKTCVDTACLHILLKFPSAACDVLTFLSIYTPPLFDLGFCSAPWEMTGSSQSGEGCHC